MLDFQSLVLHMDSKDFTGKLGFSSSNLFFSRFLSTYIYPTSVFFVGALGLQHRENMGTVNITQESRLRAVLASFILKILK